MFDAKKVKNEIVDWLRDWEECNSKYYKAILVFDIDYYCTVVSI